MNAELCEKALEKIGNPNVLVNIVSRRVRQLEMRGGSGSRPLVADYATMGFADIALSLINPRRSAFVIESFISSNLSVLKTTLFFEQFNNFAASLF